MPTMLSGYPIPARGVHRLILAVELALESGDTGVDGVLEVGRSAECERSSESPDSDVDGGVDEDRAGLHLVGLLHGRGHGKGSENGEDDGGDLHIDGSCGW